MERIKEEIENPVSSTESTVLNINEELMEEPIKEKEPIKEEEPIKSNYIIKPLAELFLEFINTKNDFNIVLSKTTIDTLCKIINLKPTFLNDIEEILLEVIKDGKIDSKDFPELISIIQKLYETIYNIKDKKLTGDSITVMCADLLKIMVYFLVKERRIKVDEEKTDLFLEQIYTLIDSCTGLLSFSKSIKLKGCFKSFFSKK